MQQAGEDRNVKGDETMEPTQHIEVPRWLWKLIYRLAKLERGQVYRLTLIMGGDEPAWAVEPVARLENWQE